MINLDDWSDCIVPGCRYKSCLRLNSPRCYQHTLGMDDDTANVVRLENIFRAMSEYPTEAKP